MGIVEGSRRNCIERWTLGDRDRYRGRIVIIKLDSFAVPIPSPSLALFPPSFRFVVFFSRSIFAYKYHRFFRFCGDEFRLFIYCSVVMWIFFFYIKLTAYA